jgi:6-phosphogluconolactonase
VNGEVRVVQDVAAAFAGLFRERQPTTFAVSGGATARACYQALAGFADLDWSAIHVLVSDERWVPVDDPDSNEGMARRELLDATGARVLSARGAGETIEEAAANYDKVVAGYEALDFVHLGLGEDGHTASLFPGSGALLETERLVVNTASDEHPHDRLTFTFPAIARARLVVVTVAGAEKHDAFTRVRNGEDLPAGRLRAQEVLWLVTPDAAGVAGT